MFYLEYSHRGFRDSTAPSRQPAASSFGICFHARPYLRVNCSPSSIAFMSENALGQALFFLC